MKRTKKNFKYRLGNACNRNNLIFYALNHPKSYFPWNNDITYIIYMAYLALVFYFLSKKTKL